MNTLERHLRSGPVIHINFLGMTVLPGSEQERPGSDSDMGYSWWDRNCVLNSGTGNW